MKANLACIIGLAGLVCVASTSVASAYTVPAIAGQVRDSSGSTGGWGTLVESYASLQNNATSGYVILEIPLTTDGTAQYYTPTIGASTYSLDATTHTQCDNISVNQAGTYYQTSGFATLPGSGNVISPGEVYVPSAGTLYTDCEVGNYGQIVYGVHW
jgi:hypothetical protein